MPLLFLAPLLGGCTGGEADVATPVVASVVPADLLATTWQVRLAVDAARAPFEGRDSWVGWFQGQRVQPTAAFAAESDPVATARAHAEYAAMYRQAALLAANATVQVYGADAQPTDPAEVTYLLGVSGALLGDATMRAKLGAAQASKVEGLAARDAAWKTWSDAGAAWPPEAPASGAPGAPGAPTPGQTPNAGALPHYQLPEQGADTRVDAGDPSTLWALARWHEAAALAAAPDQAGAVRAWIDPWRLPPEPREPAAGVVVPDSFLFMSAASTPGDVLFLSDLARDGGGAVAAHQSDSPYAVVIQSCTKTAKLDFDCVIDESARLGDAIEAGMAKAAGREDSFFRPFAEFARIGVLRAADRAAFTAGDLDAGGRLRINALDRTSAGSNSRDPLFLLSVAAWDAGNRNSVRAADLVHGLLTEIPGLEAARLPLDALHIRLSRNAAPGRPMH